MKKQLSRYGRNCRAIKLIALLTMVIAVALAPNESMAWGEDGHKILVNIAGKHLTETTRNKIDEILNGESMSSSVMWPDDVRGTTHMYTRPYHYVNVPRGATKVVLKRDSKKGKSVLGAIDKYTKVLKIPDATSKEQNEALKFLIHFVGDAHQPLHASYKDDKGGNDADVKYNGSGTNLHALWDTKLVKTLLGEREWWKYANDKSKNVSAKKIKELTDSTSLDWSNESLVITIQVYKEFGKSKDYGSDYYKKHADQVEQRLLAGGIRLAYLLNEIFDPK